jgi:replicative DNA helicase
MRNQAAHIAEGLIHSVQDLECRPQELFSQAVQSLENLVSKTARADYLRTADQVVSEMASEFNESQRGGGLETTLAELNQAIGGLQRSELILVGARPSAGKTTIVGNWVARWAENGVKVLFVSAETTAEALQKRQVSALTEIDGALILNRPYYLSPDESNRLAESWIRIAWENVAYYDPPTVRLEDLVWIADVAKHRLGGLEVIIVDYLQLLTVKMGRTNYSSNELRPIRTSREYFRVSRIGASCEACSCWLRKPKLATGQSAGSMFSVRAACKGPMTLLTQMAR